MSRQCLKPIRLSSEATASIHQNVSKGYFEVSDNGVKTFVPYDKNEFGEIHGFISPGIAQYKHMKWTKTHNWKDQKKAKASKWKYSPTFRGLNTVSK